jgi:hypothetical protein
MTFVDMLFFVNKSIVQSSQKISHFLVIFQEKIPNSD